MRNTLHETEGLGTERKDDLIIITSCPSRKTVSDVTEYCIMIKLLFFHVTHIFILINAKKCKYCSTWLWIQNQILMQIDFDEFVQLL